MPANTAPQAIDAFGIYFVCPQCHDRTRLVNSGRNGQVSLQQPAVAESIVITPPLLRYDGDLFFYYEIEKKKYRIQVTLECLTDAFGSDGSLEGDRTAFQSNILQILDVARRKISVGSLSPVKVTCSDFGL